MNTRDEILMKTSANPLENRLETNLCKKNESVVFHGVFIPKDDNEIDVEDNLHVYTDKLEALKVIKKHKRGRLKSFKDRQEAEDYARNGQEINSSLNVTGSLETSDEKGSNFKGPKPQSLTQFRKVIELGDLEAVKTTVWNNPRYLVSSGDTPAILQEGCRYNALHVAVKVTQSPEMCELILNTAGDPAFIKLLNGDEESNNYVELANILRDLYLNTPDKGLNETPLHFAAKFGLKNVVKTLVSYPQCIRTLTNKYNQTPADIICSRKSLDDKELINEIRSLLEDQYYVPVLRAEDDTMQPVIGEPFSPASPPVDMKKMNGDLLSPRVEVRAFAGPMSKSQAVEFRRKWKTPPRILGTPNKNSTTKLDRACGDCNGLVSSPVANISLRLQDTDKGLERVGRDLASEFQVSWKEYWPFLKDFTDLRCADGLDKLEEYFRNKFSNHHVRDEMTEVRKCKENKMNDEKNTSVNISALCNQFEKWTINDDSDESDESDASVADGEFFTPPSSPSIKCAESDDEMDLADDSIDDDIFLLGKYPSKVDYAAFNAIPAVIDANTHPYIYRWRHEMQLANVNGKLRFPATPSFKRQLFVNNNFK